jgi:hypothetical protein
MNWLSLKGIGDTLGKLKLSLSVYYDTHRKFRVPLVKYLAVISDYIPPLAFI